MQLSEAIIWKGIDSNIELLNKIGTVYGKYLLPTHLIAVGLGILFYLPRDYRPVLIGIIFYMYVLFLYWRTDSPTLTFPECKQYRQCGDSRGRLVWPFPHDWYITLFLIIIVIAIYYIKPIKSRLLLLTFFISTLIITWIIKLRNTGSLWCFVTAILAPILVILNYYIIKGEKDVIV
jgi:hypothetical protein